jgi:Holliday junction DNA helicase RuvA
MPIARLRGVVEDRGDDWIIVAAGGIGIRALVPSTTAALWNVGERASLFTYLHVREDALTLYGFGTPEELRLFEQLIGVSGVGPRVALSLLSSVEHAPLATAIASGQADLLKRVPGVGQKTAERIVLELRDKVVAPLGVPQTPAQPAVPGRDDELVAALMGLGYTQNEAVEAAERVGPDGQRPIEERVREALSYFART